MFSKLFVNISETSILNRLEFEKKLKEFNSSMNSLKERSILRMSPELRLEEYRKLKRKEAEEKQRKKEEEEKRLANL
jgi:hypothetical protein